jgi:hypothetical protein
VRLIVHDLDSDHTYPRALDEEDRTRNERIKNKRMILVDISNMITNRRAKPFLSKGIRNVWDIS